jgi:hypothetical protein
MIASQGPPRPRRIDPMLKEIQQELAKLIAQGIYDAAKRTPAMLSSLRKTTALRASGVGVPEGVLQRFDKAFRDAMFNSSRAGTAKWRDGKSETAFQFHLTDGITKAVNLSDWAEAAVQTADGLKQVTAIGNAAAYNKLIGSIVPRIVVEAIGACQGDHVGSDDWGWRVLTPSASVEVAHSAKKDFRPYDIFYMANGHRKETAAAYKSARKLLLPSWFGFVNPPAPFDGPFFR